MQVRLAENRRQWDEYLTAQWASPFLQSWMMGEVYRDVGETPVRLEARNDRGDIEGICQAFVVAARRGRHLSVPYGPVASSDDAFEALCDQLKKAAEDSGCSFVRISPFLPADSAEAKNAASVAKVSAPLHLLAEHVWYIPLRKDWHWNPDAPASEHEPRDGEEIMANMRKNTRNLTRRAKREGVKVVRSDDIERDMPEFIRLHDETRKRHKFTPYSNDLFHAQVKHFHKEGNCTLYLAKYEDETLASSIHMHFGGETSYHHGASTMAHPKIPATTLLQWTAINDALERGDAVYSFWGIAPQGVKRHPFAGVTLFKRGFGGEMLELMHCRDMPIRPSYVLTHAFERLRKLKRGF